MGWSWNSFIWNLYLPVKNPPKTLQGYDRYPPKKLCIPLQNPMQNSKEMQKFCWVTSKFIRGTKKHWNTIFPIISYLIHLHVTLVNWWANLALEGHCPTEFCSNPNHTPEKHNQSVYLKCIGRSVWLGLGLNYAGQWPLKAWGSCFREGVSNLGPLQSLAPTLIKHNWTS